MNRVVPLLVLVCFTAAGCREIWYYHPQDAVAEKRDGYRFWVDRGDVHIGSSCPFVVAPWKRGDESVFWGFKLQNRTEVELRLENVHLKVGDYRIRPFHPVEDKANGTRIPAHGESDYSVWFNLPDPIRDPPRCLVLAFDLAGPQGRRTQEITYSY